MLVFPSFQRMGHSRYQRILALAEFFHVQPKQMPASCYQKHEPVEPL